MLTDFPRCSASSAQLMMLIVCMVLGKVEGARITKVPTNELRKVRDWRTSCFL